MGLFQLHYSLLGPMLYMCSIVNPNFIMWNMTVFHLLEMLGECRKLHTAELSLVGIQNIWLKTHTPHKDNHAHKHPGLVLQLPVNSKRTSFHHFKITQAATLLPKKKKKERWFSSPWATSAVVFIIKCKTPPSLLLGYIFVF